MEKSVENISKKFKQSEKKFEAKLIFHIFGNSVPQADATTKASGVPGPLAGHRNNLYFQQDNKITNGTCLGVLYRKILQSFPSPEEIQLRKRWDIKE